MQVPRGLAGRTGGWHSLPRLSCSQHFGAGGQGVLVETLVHLLCQLTQGEGCYPRNHVVWEQWWGAGVRGQSPVASQFLILQVVFLALTDQTDKASLGMSPCARVVLSYWLQVKSTLLYAVLPHVFLDLETVLDVLWSTIDLTTLKPQLPRGSTGLYVISHAGVQKNMTWSRIRKQPSFNTREDWGTSRTSQPWGKSADPGPKPFRRP